MGTGSTAGSSTGESRLSSSDPILNSFSSPGARRCPIAYRGRKGQGRAWPPGYMGSGILGAACFSPRRATGREAPPARWKCWPRLGALPAAPGLQSPTRRQRGPRAGCRFVCGMPSAVSTEATHPGLRGPNFAHLFL